VVESGQVLRRWLPLLMVIAVQVLLVAVVPSRGASNDALNAAAGTAAGTPGSVGADGTGTTAGTAGTGGTGGTGGVPGSAGGSTGGSTSGSSGGSTGAGGTTGGSSASGSVPGTTSTGGAGDLSKCAKGGKLQQDVTNSSPPCTPRFTGNNGGATYQGVTGSTIKVIRYKPKSNAQVDAILNTQGLAFSAADEQASQDTYAKFFEKHYEFYGRKVQWITEQGTCEISPPDLPCFRTEVKRLNTKHRPFGVFWTNSTTQAEFFDEWSRLGVINLGGWHFNAAFNKRLRPFHWDVFMDGTRTSRNVADYWCKKMQGKNATLAGDPALRAKKRKLGILTQDYPVTRKNALDLYAFVTGGVCGSKVDAAEPVYTPSNIAQGSQTASVVVQKLKAEGVTTLVIISDPINPTFTTTAATRQQWYPEHLLAGSGLIDYDLLGRLYDQSQWRNAFGPGHLAEPIAPDKTDSFKAAADVGVRDNGAGALIFSYMSFMASMIQRSGPQLNPPNVEQGIHSLPPGGGWERTKDPQSYLISYGPDDYTAIDDSRHTYWDPGARSKIDGKAGAYVAFEGARRFEIGKWPRGEPRQ